MSHARRRCLSRRCCGAIPRHSAASTAARWSAPSTPAARCAPSAGLDRRRAAIWARTLRRPRPHRLPGASSRDRSGSPSRPPHSYAPTPGSRSSPSLSLALGIGANTAIFSLLNSVLLSTLPVRDPQALVMLTDPVDERRRRSAWQDGERSLVTYQEFLDLQRRTARWRRSMASSSSLQRIEARVDGGEPEEIALAPGLGLVLRHAGRPAAARPHLRRDARSRRKAACRMRSSATTSGSGASADAPT